MNKKQPDSRHPNQKELLNYGNELKEIVGKSFNPAGSGLKIHHNKCLLDCQYF